MLSFKSLIHAFFCVKRRSQCALFLCQEEIPVCTLETSVPFLAGVPSEWQVSLVDTPGFGEFDSRVGELIKSSSICVYLTTYNCLHAQHNADYLKFILGYDQGTCIHVYTGYQAVLTANLEYFYCVVKSVWTA